jgi:hypothetical protein
VVSVSITQDMVEHEAWRKACWIGGTPILSTTERSDQAGAATSIEQGGVERGCRLLNDPLCLASSVCMQKPARIRALSLIMVGCVLISRPAACRLRARVADTAHLIPDQGRQTDGTTTDALGVPVL